MNTSRHVTSSETAWRCTSYSSMQHKSPVTHTHTWNESRHMKRPGGACHIVARESRHTPVMSHKRTSLVPLRHRQRPGSSQWHIPHTSEAHESHLSLSLSLSLTHTHTRTHTHARANETRKSCHTSESRHTNTSVTSRYLIGNGLEVYLLARDLEGLYARG